MTRRLHYVDWLRVLAVLLLFPFHSGRIFNAGEPFYAKAVPTSQVIGLFLGIIDRWHMPLLFLLAGASSYFALRKRTPSQYAKERGLRLGVPLLFGVLAVTPLQGWYGARANSGYTTSFLSYVTSGRLFDFSAFLTRDDYFGGFVLGHLWFILFLLLISLVALPFMAWGRERGAEALSGWSRRLARPPWWLLVAVVLFIAEGLPWIGSKNLPYYLVWFLLGCVALRDDAFAASAERNRWVALAIGLAICIAYILATPWRDTLSDPGVVLTIVNITGMLGAWMTVVGMLGMGRLYLDRPSAALSYLAEASYPLYILHQTVIVALGFYLITLPGGTWVRYPLVVAASVAMTFALYEVIRRVRPLRFVFGMKPAP